MEDNISYNAKKEQQLPDSIWLSREDAEKCYSNLHVLADIVTEDPAPFEVKYLLATPQREVAEDAIQALLMAKNVLMAWVGLSGDGYGHDATNFVIKTINSALTKAQSV